MRDKAWRLLHQPTEEQVRDARQWLWSRPDDGSVHGFFVEGPEGDAGDEYCYDHATAVHRRLSRFTADGKRRSRKAEVYIGRVDSEQDGSRWCGHDGCGARLAVTLTDWGVNSALGLTEDDPMDCCIDVRELVEADNAMRADDERYRLWYFHVEEMREDAGVMPGPDHDPGDA